MDGAVVCSHSETLFRNEKRESAMAPRPDGPLLKSLDVSLQVLEALDDGVPERGISDLARDLGVSKAAVYRILSTFARRGYVAQNPATSRYAIGPRLRRFSHVASGKLDLLSVARPFLLELRDATLDTVHLAVLEGGDAVYIAKEDGLHPVQVTSRIGARCPAHCVATGKALLAHTDTAVLDQLLAAGLTRFTPLTRADPDDFRQELIRIQERGCAINTGEWRTEVRGVAAPIFDGSGRVLAALGVCSPAPRMPDSRLSEVCASVMDAANRLSTHLGVAPRTDPVRDMSHQEGMR
jgi:IclR family transcriptional regulator, KDG regulon repressor